MSLKLRGLWRIWPRNRGWLGTAVSLDTHFLSSKCVADVNFRIQSFVSRYLNCGPLLEKWMRTLRRLPPMPTLLHQRLQLLRREGTRVAHALSCNLVLFKPISHLLFTQHLRKLTWMCKRFVRTALYYPTRKQILFNRLVLISVRHSSSHLLGGFCTSFLTIPRQTSNFISFTVI